VQKRDELMRRVESLKAQQEKRQQRLGQVKNVKEANAVSAELDLGRQALGREEGDWVVQAEEVSRVEARLAEAERALVEAEAAQASERDQLALRRGEAEAARDLALAEREASAARLEKPLRTRYDRLRSSKSRNAVMALSGFACSACFTMVPVSRRGQIKGGLLIEGCEACGVILYQPEPRGVEA
jgi:predicted  nucleic acid-binding Zn-ribbon protein